MARKTIFDILESEYDIVEEISVIEELFCTTYAVIESNTEYYIEEFIDEYIIKLWKYRGTKVSIDKIRCKLNITPWQIERIERSDNIEKVITYLEFVVNMINLVWVKSAYWDEVVEDIFDVLEKNISVLLNHLGFETYKIDEEKIIIIQQKEGAFEVAETITDNDVATSVIEYNHFLLKGDIKGKKEILIKLAHRFEAIRNEIENPNYKSIVGDLGYLFNNLNIRHNNISGPKQQEYFVDMSDEQVEEWYDKTYDLFLAVMMIHKHLVSKQELDTLKKKMPHK